MCQGVVDVYYNVPRSSRRLLMCREVVDVY